MTSDLAELSVRRRACTKSMPQQRIFVAYDSAVAPQTKNMVAAAAESMGNGGDRGDCARRHSSPAPLRILPLSMNIYMVLTLALAPAILHVHSFHSKGTFVSRQLPPLSTRRVSFTTCWLAAIDGAAAPLFSTTPLSTDAFRPVLQKGLHQMNIAMHKSTSDRVFKCTPSLHRMRKQVQQLTKIDQSSLGAHAGLGLFATKNIKAGTIIGLYPAHALGYEYVVPDADTNTERDVSLFLAMNDIDETYFTDRQPHNNSPYLHATDQPIFQRQSMLASLFGNTGKVGGGVAPPPLYLDVNPNRNHELDGIWTSHYINDGSSLLNHKTNVGTSSSSSSSSTIEDGIEQYYLQSTQAKNCIHIPFGPSPVLATITTKKVKKGQELFTSYGVVYWLGALSTTATRSVDDGAPGMTEKIQTQIVQSARDLQQAMEEAKRGYAVEMDDLTTVLGQLN